MGYSEWKTYKFSDFVLINSSFPMKGNDTFSFIEMKDLSQGKRVVLPSAEKKLTGGARFKENDTLFARITPCLQNGKIGQAKGLKNNIGFGSTEFLVFREKENISTNDFIYYLACWQDVRKFAEQNMVGTSGRQRVGKEAFEKLELVLPNVEIQKKISSLLSSLDDKIELNRQTNRTLEGMAQTLFKEMCLPKGDELDDGWRVGKLGEILESKGGTTPSTKNKEFWNGEFNWATPKDLSNLKMSVLLSTERSITEKGLKQISSGLLPAGTLLMSSRAPIGYFAISQIPIAINQGFIAINGKTVSNLFLLYWLKENLEKVKSMGNGSTFLEISKTAFRNIEIIIPTSEILEQHKTLIKPIFENIVLNEKENQTLITLRDSLLQKLMKGEIELNN